MSQADGHLMKIRHFVVFVTAAVVVVVVDVLFQTATAINRRCESIVDRMCEQNMEVLRRSQRKARQTDCLQQQLLCNVK